VTDLLPGVSVRPRAITYNQVQDGMPTEIDTFQLEKRTLGQILSSTSPPIRVPDYQRDFRWKEEQITDFWSDLIAFGGNDPHARLAGKEYFLGAAVLVNNGVYVTARWTTASRHLDDLVGSVARQDQRIQG
jgi:uncharacterized protein DUF262